jgi:putative alpha-1,2-mannosidase
LAWISAGVIAAGGVLALLPATAQAAAADLTGLVNPLIGTRREGNTFPGAALPFGMVQVSPDTGRSTGYGYDSPQVWGFSQTHLSGVGCSAGTEIR